MEENNDLKDSKINICHDPFIQFPLCFISWIDFWRIEQMPVLFSADAVLVCIHFLEFSNHFLPMACYDFVSLIKVVFNKHATHNRQAEKVVIADTASKAYWSSSCLYEFAILALDSDRCTMKPCLYSLSCRHILQNFKNILYFSIVFLWMISSNIEETRLTLLVMGGGLKDPQLTPFAIAHFF